MNKKLEIWIRENRRKLISTRPKAERFLLEKLPRKYKKSAKIQHPIVVNDHVYFIDIYLPSIQVAIEVDGWSHADLLCVHQFKPTSHPILTHEEYCPEEEAYLKASPNDWWCRTGDLLKKEHRELYWR